MVVIGSRRVCTCYLDCLQLCAFFHFSSSLNSSCRVVHFNSILPLILHAGLCTGLLDDVLVWSGAVAFLCATGDKECCGCQVATDCWILWLYSNDPVEHL